ncbi:MAG: bifunctional phosphopantothenoylcysteine decarboxylase/phosphopantothenate--cysteine ligase CoaBC [candidate division Zixibacteria bacterium]|nr:bifunctional phosphopantothenoylcysteine decarboxylase/phosphopantothenate--cysteine ligase CoaBC [candidate division Zixibacteria bacterium]
MSLAGKKIMVGLTGGIASYKVPNLVRLLTKEKAEVVVMMTDSACKFITPLTLETVSNRPVITGLWPEGEFVSTRHIDVAEWPDLIVIAPATANFMGKIFAGISDDFVTTVMCATSRPTMIAPAMNPQMWLNPTTQRNLGYLKQLGFHIIDPEEGEMACDSVGVGRMAEPEVIFRAIENFFDSGAKKKALTGKTILVTAGPTREAIDPVRFISNRSSGRMGYAIAAASAELNARTILVSGPTNLEVPRNVEHIRIESTQQMYEAIKSRFSEVDCLIMAAAPADFIPASISPQKIKKTNKPSVLELDPATDILASLSKDKRKSQRLIGFALETENGLENARAKLKNKQLDLIVLNSLADSGAGFDVHTNKLTLISQNGKTNEWPLMTKTEAAIKLLEVVAGLL